VWFRKLNISRLAVLPTIVLALSCAADPGEPAATALTIDYPATGSIFPPEITSPTFIWHDNAKQAKVWRIDVEFRNGAAAMHFQAPGAPMKIGNIDPRCVASTNKVPELSPEQATAHTWAPDNQIWETIKKNSTAHPATVSILGFAAEGQEQPSSRGSITIQTSNDPVGAPIFYRDVPLMPSETEKGIIKPLATNAIPLIQWRLRNISMPESRVVLEGMHTCANCHSFSRDGKTMGMDMDGPANDKGLYALAPIQPQMSIGTKDMVSWNPSEDGQFAFNRVGFMSQVSPDGSYVLTTVSRGDRAPQNNFYVANFNNYRFLQVFYPTRGILAWYRRGTGERRPLPGADDPRYVQTDGVWSPDGKYVVFARALAKESYPVDGKMAEFANDPKEVQIQYDLYRIPFNDGRGGKAEPILGASANGMSNTFPKVSPDGRWIVFVQCHNGQLMRPDSQLYIVPVEGGKARRLRANAPPMNSWHSFSPNGRWLVFSSKRRSPYTQMYLTHIDEQGNDSPAILVDNSTAANRAVNLPEFVNIPQNGLVKISTPAVDVYKKFDEAVDLAKTGSPEAAISKWEEVAKLDPADARVQNNLGSALAWSGQYQEAISHYRKGLELNPQYHAIHNNLGLALLATGQFDEAVRQFRQGLGSYPESAELHNNLGQALAAQGHLEEAKPEFTKALAINPNSGETQNNLGRVLQQSGHLNAAIAQFEQAVQINPNLAEAQNDLGVALISASKLDEARPHFEKALEINPQFAEAHCYLGIVLYYSQGDVKDALAHWRQALLLQPKNLLAMNQEAHALAAGPESDELDYGQALKLAQQAVQLSAGHDPTMLDTLAIAYAAAGRFTDADQTAHRALELAAEQQRTQLVEALNTKIKLYQANQPYRDTWNQLK
jgi:tetratricopeptide (TPR) repeat protein/Tol biopolymer transport system component